MRTDEEQIESLEKMIHNERKIEKLEKSQKTKKKRDSPSKITPPQPLNQSPKPRLNEIAIEMLTRIIALMKKNRDTVRVLAYKRALEAIQGIPTDITNFDDLAGKKYIGTAIIEKLKYYKEHRTLQMFEEEKAKPEYAFKEVYEQISEIYGIGPKKAKDLVDAGITSLDDLRQRQDELLNANQKAGLKYYEDILQRIPRAEIDEYNALFGDIFRKIIDTNPATYEGAKYEIVGSYRRGLASSGDIDMIITAKNPALFKEFTSALTTKNIILETLSCGATKCLVIARLHNKTVARRIDFLYSSPEEYPFAILYFTGSKEFNTSMRSHALQLGFSLNEHGMYTKQPGQKKEAKVSHQFETEKDIFDFLQLVYREPVERVDGKAVIVKEVGSTTQVQREPETSDKIEEVQPKEKKTRKKREPKEPKPPKEPKAPKTRKIREPKPPKMAKEPTKAPKPKKSPKPKKMPAIHITEEIVPIIPNELPKKEEQEPPIPIVPIITEPKTIKIKVKKNQTRKVTKEEKNIKLREQQPSIMPPKQPSAKSITTIINDFKTNGISVLENHSEVELAAMLKLANDNYYNTDHSLMTDAEYDILKEYIERTYPQNEVLDEIGAAIVGQKNKVTLPYQMASMNKIKPDSNALPSWTNKYTGPYVLSCKLDGVSGMYVVSKDKSQPPKLYTRGNGIVGQDISHLIRVLKLPDRETIFKNQAANSMIASATTIAFRGEFIIPKAMFDQKYKAKFANPRNLVSGIINSKTVDEKAADLHFVAYEVVDPPMNPSEQLKLVTDLGFEVVQNQTVIALSNESLSDILMDWRTNYMYEIDGVIVTDDNIHPRREGNPEHAFAFKMVISDQVAEAKVIDVIWTPSKSGYLKPRVRIEPIKLGGVTIEYATGFNGAFIEKNKIGIGAIIQLIRSGDVIPYIKSVTTPAEHAKMPIVPYHWTDTHVDIVVDNIDEDPDVLERNLTAFFTTLEVEGLARGNIKRVIKAGFNSIPKILHMTKQDFTKVEGFKDKLIDKVYSSIHEKVDAASLLDIMVASNMLGRGLGERKIRPILETYPAILTSQEAPERKIAMLQGISGIGKENAQIFVSNIDKFLRFLEQAGLEGKLTQSPAKTGTTVTEPLENEFQTDHPLYKKHIVMTKVRDSTIIEGLKRVGGILDDNTSKNTFAVIAKSKDDVSNKAKYARDHGIPIYEPAEFIAKYNIA